MKLKSLGYLVLLVFLLCSTDVEARWPFGISKLYAVTPYLDVRGKDLTELDPKTVVDLQPTLWLNRDVLWPTDDLKNKAENLLQAGMNPGLGIRALHEQGITGKGVKVAIIDQGLVGEHEEYSGKVVEYTRIPDVESGSMHGPAVASLLVGTNCGTAPGAELYYTAILTDKPDATPIAKALDLIVETNARLPSDDRIRVVSISAAPTGRGSIFTTGTKEYDAAVQRAIKTGLLVLDCSEKYGFIGPCTLEPSAPDDLSSVRYRLNARSKLLVPCSPRTTAEIYEKDYPSYQYTGQGGLSWSIPYAAGVLAMGWQVDPSLTKEQILNLLWKSAYLKDGYKIINPPEFIRMVKKNSVAK